MRPTLGLTGVTVNAMALIAPGAFLWITLQIQAAQTIPGGTTSTALDMWPGIVFALILAFFTALSYSELARVYPEAGSGSCYYFAEKAFVDKSEARHHRWARVAKLVTGWAAHLFYWVYPGVMVAFMAILISFILGQFGIDVGVPAQMVIAVLFSVLVGFIALVIQGLFAYLIEYFAANFALSDKLTGTAADGTVLTGLDAAAASSAPMGDLIRVIGDSLLGGVGFGLMVVIAITVALAILGTTLSAMNTGVRITFAMAQDKEMPEPLGLLHSTFVTPHMAVFAMIAVSAVIGVIGVISVVTLTGITLASNFGTFVLYALTCLWAIIAFASRPDFNWLKHLVVPGLGLLANIVMLVTILGVGIVGGGDSQTESLIAVGFAAVWAVASGIYVVMSNRRTGRSLVTQPKAAA